MFSEPRKLLPRLGFDKRGKGFFFRVERAGEGKVLPHQHAEFIAHFIKSSLLVDTAAPHPQHIHIARHTPAKCAPGNAPGSRA